MLRTWESGRTMPWWGGKKWTFWSLSCPNREKTKNIENEECSNQSIENKMDNKRQWGIHLTQVTTICWGRAPQAPVISASKLGRQEPVLDRQSSTGVKGSQRDFRVQALTGRHSGPSKALLAAPARVSTTSTHNGLGLPESNGYPTSDIMDYPTKVLKEGELREIRY